MFARLVNLWRRFRGEERLSPGNYAVTLASGIQKVVGAPSIAEVRRHVAALWPDEITVSITKVIKGR